VVDDRVVVAGEEENDRWDGGRQRAGYPLCVRLSAPRACKTKVTVYFQ
jgi:hypothetical protein